ncbi:hypothetical protein F5Y17DRAFT_145862 [Xylariaceae sp. FL0594]|nr:hypothetical protein F5Y17DRAFT_145862 [Xylariaceae sp. FL0594]
MGDNYLGRRPKPSQTPSDEDYPPFFQHQSHDVPGYPPRLRSVSIPSASIINTPSPRERGMTGRGSYSGSYYPPDQHASYATNYAQDGRQAQGYNPYSQYMGYHDVPQAGVPDALYGPNTHFPSRTPAGLHMVSPNVGTTYYQSQPPSAGASAHIQQQAPASGSSAVCHHEPAGGRLMQQSYSEPIASSSAVAHQAASDEIQKAVGGGAPMRDAYTYFQRMLKEIFTAIGEGSLKRASKLLRRLTKWLLPNVKQLGLTVDEVDDEDLRQERLGLWQDFNYAWLAFCQKQKDMTEPVTRQQVRQHNPMNSVTTERLITMANELVSQCDAIERYGLVDFENGVWEDWIVDILLQCLKLSKSKAEIAQSNLTVVKHSPVYKGGC